MNFDAKRIDFKEKIRARDNVICDISGFICIVKKYEHERRQLCGICIKSVLRQEKSTQYVGEILTLFG